ncbi:immunoglobulin E-set [Scheffersomyces xylosifermentans]|uniref:immunoglobulin E-set n=1 Tax=Scheffersomyces xylosifermentans TaxID=1304137 RepID=UPI00315D61A0
MSHLQDDDLIPETVEGYTVGEKKTIAEYTKLDAEDESLAKWKASLGLADDSNAYPVKAGDNRKVVVVEIALEFPDQPNLQPIIVNLEDAQGNTIVGKEIKFNIKEKSVYQLVIKFRVQHEIITGLKYLHSIKKSGIRVEKVEEPLGSYAPNTKDKPYYERKFAEVEAPSGFLARGNYSAITKFVDDDKNVHLSFPWSFTIAK